MKTLLPDLRRRLERTIADARDVAETGARAALEALAVHEHEPYVHMDEGQRALRQRLRAHARQLGDPLDARSRGQSRAIECLVQECAYEHWHGMLFARFLAENRLLIEPEMGVAVTLDECEELAKEEGADKWALAARFAHRMLPQVFRPDLPVFEVRFAREHRLKLEGLVECLPADVFTATDSLGWVYQFWQSRKKAEVNRSEVKIGAGELPAVTQLFTEPYMVQFLLHNSLGAWWVSRHPDKPRPAELTYLRETEQVSLEAGGLESWPDDLAAFRILDPCCGSGHFLVAAFLMLVPMRMTLEGLDAGEAVDAVLRDNLHGLELDRRCVAIAAFALALEAWRYPGAGGYRPLPRIRLAWCGQPVGGKREQWVALAEGDPRRKAGMSALYDMFREASVLGSLIDPSRSFGDLLTADFADLEQLLGTALRKHAGDEEYEEAAIAARGLAEAADLLTSRYHLVVTNVPYLGREKHTESLRRFCEGHYPVSKHDLATVFVERLMEFCEPAGDVFLVLPWNWLFLKRHKRLRKQLLERHQWRFLVTLGAGAFETISGEVVKTCLLAISRSPGKGTDDLSWLDVSECQGPSNKERALRKAPAVPLTRSGQIANPDSIIGYAPAESCELLETRAYSYQGLATSDNAQFVFNFWELPAIERGWEFFQFAPDATTDMSGCSHVIFWGDGQGRYANHAAALRLEGRLGGWQSGHAAWGKRGIAINRMGDLPASLYFGSKFDCNVAVLIPCDEKDVPAIWAYCSSPKYGEDVRKLNKKLSVTNGALAKVPYSAEKWERTAGGRTTVDLFSVHTTDPTQWAFHGHPGDATDPLQVAMARILGYRWPAEGDPGMELSEAARARVGDTGTLHDFEDKDGIVCLPSVLGERPAEERLLGLLAACWGAEWHDGVLSDLLVNAGSFSLDDWLRDRFFDRHCKLFHNRPFIWHVWDGRRGDGFHAFVNYHKLAAGDGRGRQLLESLTYSYLGDWISRQQDASKRNRGGAEDRLAAALELQKRLVAILEGEPPFDIFIRWKPIDRQPIGWAPDIDDGVRLNIRPFMADDIPGGRRGAGILRSRPNLHWKKDRGKEPLRNQTCFPWFWEDDVFTGARINDEHLRNAEKQHRRTMANASRSMSFEYDGALREEA